jgi:hypothetical protein
VRYVLETIGDRGADKPFDRDFWLTHREGYRVETDLGRLGFVETVLRGDNPPHDTRLAVRAGRLGRRIVLVPLGSVAFIVPRAERIWLRTSDCS